MIYSKVKFGIELKKRVLKRESIADIGTWAYSVYLDWPDVNDVQFLNLLVFLNTMELGSEFAISYKNLETIANNLIEGKDIQLNR